MLLSKLKPDKVKKSHFLWHFQKKYLYKIMIVANYVFVWEKKNCVRNWWVLYNSEYLLTPWYSHFQQESIKPVFQSGSDLQQLETQEVLHHCVDTFLRAASPFMPFLTEELFQRLPARGDNWPESVCIAQYPKPHAVSGWSFELYTVKIKEVWIWELDQNKCFFKN